MQELCFKGFETCPVNILRFSSVYGPRLRLYGGEATIIAQIAGWIQSGQSPRLFEDGRQMRDWVYVGDVVAAITRLLNGTEAPTLINVCSGVGTPLGEACEAIASAYGVHCDPELVGSFRAGDMRHCLGDAMAFDRCPLLRWNRNHGDKRNLFDGRRVGRDGCQVGHLEHRIPDVGHTDPRRLRIFVRGRHDSLRYDGKRSDRFAGKLCRPHVFSCPGSSRADYTRAIEELYRNMFRSMYWVFPKVAELIGAVWSLIVGTPLEIGTVLWTSALFTAGCFTVTVIYFARKDY